MTVSGLLGEKKKNINFSHFDEFYTYIEVTAARNNLFLKNLSPEIGGDVNASVSCYHPENDRSKTYQQEF